MTVSSTTVAWLVGSETLLDPENLPVSSRVSRSIHSVILAAPRSRFPAPDLWLDASQTATLTLDGTAVAGWASQINAAHDFTAEGDAQPTYVADGIGGKPAIDFDGTNDYLSLAALPLGGTAGNTIIAVFASDANDSRSAIYSQMDKDVDNRHISVGRLQTGTPALAPYVLAINTSTQQRTGATALAATTTYCVTWRLTAAQIGQAWVGYTAETMNLGTAMAAGYNFGGITGADLSAVGGAVDATTGLIYPFNGKIAEVIGWNRTLSGKHIRGVQRYLTRKYGL